MVLFPKTTKFKKEQRGRLKGKASKNNKISFGNCALQATEPIWLTSKQIEAFRRVLSRETKKLGKFVIKVFPQKPITMRSPESRMGSGKGNVDHWVARIKPGHLLAELKDIPLNLAIIIFKKASYKLPLKTRFITNENI